MDKKKLELLYDKMTGRILTPHGFFQTQLDFDLISIGHQAEIVKNIKYSEDIISILMPDSYHCTVLYRNKYRYKLYNGEELIFTASLLKDVIKHVYENNI